MEIESEITMSETAFQNKIEAEENDIASNISSSNPVDVTLHQHKKRRKMGKNSSITSNLNEDSTTTSSTTSTSSGSIVYIKQGLKNSKIMFYLLEQLMIKHNLDSTSTLKQINPLKKSFGNCYELLFDSSRSAENFTNSLKRLLPVKVNKIFISDNNSTSSDNSSENASSSTSSDNSTSSSTSSGVHFNVEILPINIDDLICLPKPLFNSFGGQIGPFMICYKFQNGNAFFVDPQTSKCVEISPTDYYKSSQNSFQPIFQSNLHLTKFVVLSKEQNFEKKLKNQNNKNEKKKDKDNEMIIEKEKNNNNKKKEDEGNEMMIENENDDNNNNNQNNNQNNNNNLNKNKNKIFSLGNITIVAEEEIGQPNREFIIKTHLFDEIEEGDIWFGYNLKNLNSNDEYVMSFIENNDEENNKNNKNNSSSKKKNVNAIILVRKSNGDNLNSNNRIWTLKDSKNKSLHEFRDDQNENDLRDYDIFYDIVEQNSFLRKQVLMYKNKKLTEQINLNNNNNNNEKKDGGVATNNNNSNISKYIVDGVVKTTKNQSIKIEDLLDDLTI